MSASGEQREIVTRNVVVSGAGPAGLLMSLLLLKRNADPTKRVKYNITLIDKLQDYGLLSIQDLQANHRSWMIGLAGHGIQAIRTELPELFNDYVKPNSVLLTALSIHIGSKEMKTEGQPGDENFQEGYIVDRNFIVAALARYMHDQYDANHPYLAKKYDSSIMYVDGETKRVLVRPNNSADKEYYINYDLLIGCDGKVSVVRDAIQKQHFDFECHVNDIFSTFKSVHVPCPPGVNPSSLHLLPTIFPSCQGIGLPETNGMINIGVGYFRSKKDVVPAELLSDDAAVVTDYVRKTFTNFGPDFDCESFGKQWVNMRWNRTAQVHCNFYHSVPCSIIIMGDAAHATSPSIGMGMNTALRDAYSLYTILNGCHDDLSLVLPEFSKQRVPEGNALSDLALHLYCIDTKYQLMETIHMVVRSAFHTKFPKWVQEHPQVMVGNPKYTLAECYTVAKEQGIITRHRYINDKLRQDFFEEQVGMITRPINQRSASTTFKMFVMVVLAIGITASYYYGKEGTLALLK